MQCDVNAMCTPCCHAAMLPARSSFAPLYNSRTENKTICMPASFAPFTILGEKREIVIMYVRLCPCSYPWPYSCLCLVHGLVLMLMLMLMSTPVNAVLNEKSRHSPLLDPGTERNETVEWVVEVVSQLNCTWRV